MAERVGNVSDFGASTEFRSGARAQLQIADQGLSTDQELVGQDIPRTDGEPARLDEIDQSLTVLRPRFEIILEHDRLAIEFEGRERFRVLFHQVEQVVDELHQLVAILLERQVPRPVPMGVRHDVTEDLRLAWLGRR